MTDKAIDRAYYAFAVPSSALCGLVFGFPYGAILAGAIIIFSLTVATAMKR